MSMKTKAAIVMSSAAVLLFMYVGGLDGVRASNNDGSYRQLQVYSEVLSRVRSEYVEEPNIPLVTDGALHGLLESLDSNSSYLTAAEYKEYKANQTEAKGEIGAAVSKRFGYAAVISVIPGGPADKAGIQASDIFEAIEGKSTREMSLAEIHNLLLGPARFEPERVGGSGPPRRTAEDGHHPRYRDRSAGHRQDGGRRYRLHPGGRLQQRQGAGSRSQSSRRCRSRAPRS